MAPLEAFTGNETKHGKSIACHGAPDHPGCHFCGSGHRVIVIILQAKGVGIGSLFGSNEAGLGITKTRRGLEKTLHQITIVLGAAFLLNAVIQVIIQR
jgi:protein translocase SecG subunit